MDPQQNIQTPAQNVTPVVNQPVQPVYTLEQFKAGVPVPQMNVQPNVVTATQTAPIPNTPVVAAPVASPPAPVVTPPIVEEKEFDVLDELFLWPWFCEDDEQPVVSAPIQPIVTPQPEPIVTPNVTTTP